MSEERKPREFWISIGDEIKVNCLRHVVETDSQGLGFSKPQWHRVQVIEGEHERPIVSQNAIVAAKEYQILKYKSLCEQLAKALEVATTPLARDRQEVIEALANYRKQIGEEK